jgi:hypothetical protein
LTDNSLLLGASTLGADTFYGVTDFLFLAGDSTGGFRIGEGFGLFLLMGDFLTSSIGSMLRLAFPLESDRLVP